MAIYPETQYAGKIAPSSAEYPYGEARNITVPGDGTGTPWEAALVNDLFGLQQALLEAAGITPSGDPDTAINSQYLLSLRSLAPIRASSRTEMKGYDVPAGYQFSLEEGGRSGTFVVKTGVPPSDSLEGVFVVLDNGNYAERVRSGGKIFIEWFGADPSGVHDSGPAIREAHVFSLGDQINGASTGGATFTRPCLEVAALSKNGTFRISTSVSWSTFARFDGGGCVYFPDAGLAGGMFTGDGYLSHFKNAIFSENIDSPTPYTHVAFDLDSSNKDQGITVFEKLEFKGLLSGADYDLQSSYVVFSGCKWDKCRHFIRQSAADSCVISGGFGTQGDLSVDGSGTFQIDGGNLLITSGFLGVPTPATGNETAWIDMNGTHLVVDGRSRFGGETGSKTLVNWKTPISLTAPLSPRSINIKDNWLDMIDGGDGDSDTSPSCVVRLFTVPNHVVITGNRGMVNTRHVVAWARSVDTSSARADLDGYIEDDLYNNNRNINTDIAGRSSINYIIENNSQQIVNGPGFVEYPDKYANLFSGKPLYLDKKPCTVFFEFDPITSTNIYTRPEVVVLDSSTVQLHLPIATSCNIEASVTINSSRLSNPNYRASRTARFDIFVGDNGTVQKTYKTTNMGDTTEPSGFISVPAIPTLKARFKDSSGVVSDTIAPGELASLVIEVSGLNNTSGTNFEDGVQVAVSNT